MDEEEGCQVNVPKDVLESATTEMLGGRVEELPLDRLLHLITVTQHAVDILTNELERRGEIKIAEDGAPCIPYMSDYILPYSDAVGVQATSSRAGSNGSASWYA